MRAGAAVMSRSGHRGAESSSVSFYLCCWIRACVPRKRPRSATSASNWAAGIAVNGSIVTTRRLALQARLQIPATRGVDEDHRAQETAAALHEPAVLRIQREGTILVAEQVRVEVTQESHPRRRCVHAARWLHVVAGSTRRRDRKPGPCGEVFRRGRPIAHSISPAQLNQRVLRPVPLGWRFFPKAVAGQAGDARHPRVGEEMGARLPLPNPGKLGDAHEFRPGGGQLPRDHRHRLGQEFVGQTELRSPWPASRGEDRAEELDQPPHVVGADQVQRAAHEPGDDGVVRLRVGGRRQARPDGVGSDPLILGLQPDEMPHHLGRRAQWPGKPLSPHPLPNQIHEPTVLVASRSRGLSRVEVWRGSDKPWLLREITVRLRVSPRKGIRRSFRRSRACGACVVHRGASNYTRCLE